MFQNKTIKSLFLFRISSQYNLRVTPKKISPPTDPVPAPAPASGPITLSIDIGGTGIKAMLLSATAEPLGERIRILTPAEPTPAAVTKILDQIVKQHPDFDRVSVGFPGVVHAGVTYDAVNLHPGWVKYKLQARLEARWKKPVRVANDADIAGCGAIKGQGVELVLTLGTGLGGALFTDGHLCPGLEIGHHPWKKKTYEDYLGKAGLKALGKVRWNQYLLEAIEQTRALFNWDHLYLGGGHTRKIEVKLPKGVTTVSSDMGLTGGVALWR